MINRLSDWFHDAKTGQLMRDEWEPVPFGEGQDTRGGYFDIGFFQELALNFGSGVGWRCGQARLLADILGGGVVFLAPGVNLDNNEEVEGVRNQILRQPEDGNVKEHIPWIFVWTDRDNPIAHQIFNVWNTYGEVEAGLTGTGVEGILPGAIMTALMTLGRPGGVNARPAALLVGVWRPESISELVFGVSSDPDARRLEIRAYLLQCDFNRNNPIDPATPARQLLGIQLPTRKMLSFTSGLDLDQPVAIFGYGALGSSIADFLVRSGIRNICALDKERIEPHNLARHSALVADLYVDKGAHLTKVARDVTFFNDEISARSMSLDISALPDHAFADICADYPIIVDATADERVRRRLARATLSPGNRIVRIEIFHEGRLGALFLTGVENRPNVVDLYYDLCVRAVSHKTVEGWLRSEQAAGTTTDELLIGMGCSSTTTRMPKYKVAQHSSAFMPTIVGVAQGQHIRAGTGINPLNLDDSPLGWKWFDYGGDPVVFYSEKTSGWEVRMSPSAAASLDQNWRTHQDVEAGGYLYGGYDFTLKQVYVVAVSDIPPGTRQSAASIDLGPAGRTPLERRIVRSAGGKVGLVGTWHSHPNSSPEISSIDQKTINGFLELDQTNGVPTLLVITSPNGTIAYLWA